MSKKIEMLNEKAKEIEWYDRYGLLQLLNQITKNYKNGG